MPIYDLYTDRVDQYIRNSDEFNQLWRDLSLIIGGVEAAVDEALDGVSGHARDDQFGISLSSGEDSEDLQVEIRFLEGTDSVRILFRKHGNFLKKKSDYDLPTLREVHRRRGAVLYLAERFCSRWGRHSTLVGKLRRFDIHI